MAIELGMAPAKPDACEETPHDQARKRIGERAGEHRDDPEGKRRANDHGPAPNAISQRSERQCAEHQANEPGRADPLHHAAGELPVFGNRWIEVTDHLGVEPVEEHDGGTQCGNANLKRADPLLV